GAGLDDTLILTLVKEDDALKIASARILSEPTTAALKKQREAALAPKSEETPFDPWVFLPAASVVSLGLFALLAGLLLGEPRAFSRLLALLGAAIIAGGVALGVLVCAKPQVEAKPPSPSPDKDVARLAKLVPLRRDLETDGAKSLDALVRRIPGSGAAADV